METRRNPSGLHSSGQALELTGYELRLIQGLARGKQVLAVDLPKLALESLGATAALVVALNCLKIPGNVKISLSSLDHVWQHGPFDLVVTGSDEILYYPDLLLPEGIMAVFGRNQSKTLNHLVPSQFLDTQHGLEIWRLKPNV